ncbi:MAG: aminotransferase class I/II-fold pyridoxal phosphate-dependent enzyme, partial [Clostridia bacterium]|nr:aminotransferase class I/II-fold pyridoxal phosphate-dependent enzyme [Clostridia bacterium]
RFENDYCDGALPEVMEALLLTNNERTNVYSEDYHCEEARHIIQRLCQNERAAVHFLPGGTIANVTLLTSALMPYQGIVSSSVGHIHVHETGAVEARGHKILPIASTDGKITANKIRKLFDMHYADPNHEHTVQPGIVYITNPTEYGAIYQKDELCEISRVCRACGMYLYLDGARLGYALTAEHNDLTLADLARYCDAFTIGGTKHGALFGEALVITNDRLKANFRYCIKQSGALTAKGRLLGVQFTALLENDLYFRTSKESNRKATKIRDALKAKGYAFLLESETNQQFPIFPDRELALLSEKYAFSPITRIDEHSSCVRICTNWSTSDADIDALIADIQKLSDRK